jgi:hypothetical protein
LGKFLHLKSPFKVIRIRLPARLNTEFSLLRAFELRCRLRQPVAPELFLSTQDW